MASPRGPSDSREKLPAVVAAAGRSARFGSDKLCFRIGDRAILERLITTLRAGGADPIIVVTGPDHADRARLARLANAVVDDRAPTPATMLESLVRGLALAPPGPALLCPADLPFLEPATVTAIVRAGLGSGSGVIPMYLGHRGHPILVSEALRRLVPGLDPARGLRQLLDEARNELLVIEVADAGTRRDVDLPTDLGVSSPK